MFDDDVQRYTSSAGADIVFVIDDGDGSGGAADNDWRPKSESHCISDRNSLKLIDWFERKPSFSYTSSATLAAIGACNPTRTNIDSNSKRFFCVDWVSCEPPYDPAFMRSHLFHSSYKLLDRFSKSKLPVVSRWACMEQDENKIWITHKEINRGWDEYMWGKW